MLPDAPHPAAFVQRGYDQGLRALPTQEFQTMSVEVQARCLQASDVVADDAFSPPLLFLFLLQVQISIEYYATADHKNENAFTASQAFGMYVYRPAP